MAQVEKENNFESSNENYSCNNQDNKKMSFLSKMAVCLLVVILVPLMLLGFVLYFLLFILPSPVEYAIYKKSSFCKDTKSKYHFGICRGYSYQNYTLFKKSGIKVEYHTSKKEDSIASYFEFENFFLFYDCFEDFGYFTQDEEWEVEICEEDAPMLFKDEFAKIVKKEIENLTKPAKYLMEESCFYFDYSENRRKNKNKERDIERANKDPSLLVCKNKRDLVAKVKELINSNIKATTHTKS